MDIIERRLSTAEVQELSLPLQNDLIAIFGVIGDAADRLLDKAVSEGWTPEMLIDEIVRLIDGDNRAPETVAMTKVEELKVNKSGITTLRVLEKSLETLLVMKAAKPVGAISERKDGNYRKVSAGVWEKVTDQKEGAKEEPETKQASDPKKEYDDVVAKYKGTDQWMKSPNGQPTKLNEKQWVQTRTPSFKKWFGDFEKDPANASKAVDENGEPLILYHGSGKTFDEFKQVGSIHQQYGAGYYFTEDKKIAEGYGGTKIYEVFINARYGIKEKREDALAGRPLKESDYVASKDKEPDNPQKIWMVKNPNQIKSATDNEGSFDMNSDKISKSVGGE